MVYAGLKPNVIAGEDLSAGPISMGTAPEASWVSKAVFSILHTVVHSRLHGC